MVHNKAQIARERASKTLELPRPKTPVVREYVVHALDVRHNLLRPLYLKILDPPLVMDYRKASSRGAYGQDPF